MEDLFKEQQELVNYFFDNLDYQQIEDFADLILRVNQNNGVLYLTGMGKSGIISHNISQMLVSIGIRAMFLSPVDALHGDVGVLMPNDILILFSRSGQTSELVNLLPAARNKGSQLVAVVSNQDGALAKQCDYTIYLPLKKELCPFDLAPTTSSVIQLIFGNTVVATLMRRINLTKEEYAKNHPAGRIGKRLTVKVDDMMKPRSNLAICGPDELLINQIGNMSAKRCGSLLVENENKKLVGIFTDGDLRRAIEEYGSSALQKPIRDLMTEDPFTCMKGQMAFDSMQNMERYDEKMSKKRVKEMPVVDGNNRIEGLLLLHDLVEFGL